MTLFGWNKRIIAVINSCKREQFNELITDILKEPNPEKFFRKKRYIWNIIRPRDFYKSLASYVVDSLKDITTNPSEEALLKSEILITAVLGTTNDFTIKKSFIWNIMKQVPLVTLETIQYAAPEKITSLLQSDKTLITDDSVQPFVEEVRRLRMKIDSMQQEIQTLQILSD